MVRLVVLIAVCALAYVGLHRVTAAESGGALSAPHVDTSKVPPQFRQLLADRPDPAAILRSRGALPGLGAIKQLTGRGAASAGATPAARPFSDVGTRAQLRGVRADIRRDIRELNRLSKGDGASAAEVQAALARVYSRPVLDALGAAGRSAFAAEVAGRTRASQRLAVLDFGGIFVSGRRALAQVVYRMSVRAPSGRFVARAPATWTVTLAREDGRWRFVRGFEAG